jgi:hypothetical protein
MRPAGCLIGLALALPLGAQEAEPPPPEPRPLPRAAGPIILDGVLQDPGWQGALLVDAFYETAFGDNRPPTVKTTALLAYDDHYLYVGLACDDPDPSKIRAPYVDRDQVIGTDDNVALFLDTRNDRRSAQEFRVSPRGIQADGVFNDANGNEDFAPDFYYDTAARIDERGWQAEVRIPLTSLRYGTQDPQRWGILIWRNYPRDFRYAIYSSPLPRGANCLICRSMELTGITRLPSSSHLVVAPYVSGQQVSEAPQPGAPLAEGDADGEIGLDVKWNPSSGLALDATLNPDFSQIEADVAQIAVNNRFALFFPEKRPFFLEGVDLFDTPIQAVYTRTITSPRWGGRTTGKLGPSAYTLLVTQDRGGGSVVLPGPTGSELAPQDFGSFVGIGRWRRDLGASFVGLLYTGREVEQADGGGHNRVCGADAQWRPNERETLSAQLLISDTEDPRVPETPTGQPYGTSHALHLNWNHQTRGVDWNARYRDFGDAFRADQGFVTQAGYRLGSAELGYRFYPGKGVFSFIRPYAFAGYSYDREGGLVRRQLFPGVFVQGRRNLVAEIDLNLDTVLTAGRLLSVTNLSYFFQVDPSRRFPRIGANGFLGEDVDLAGARVGRGGSVTAFATLRPDDHITLELNSGFSWLDVDADPQSAARLFTAQVQRLKAVYTFNPRMFVRLIGQYVETERDPSLYPFPVPAREAYFSGSALFSYRLNWQTALFLGYGDERALDPARDRLARTSRQLFVKLSYSFQR